jgi:hypothetical protein
MKKIYIPVITLILFSFVMSGMMSCKKNSFLAPVNTTNLTQSLIFSDSAYTVGFLANIYSNVDFATSPSRFAFTTPAGTSITCGGLDAASDESEVSNDYATVALYFAIGAVDQNNVVDASSGASDGQADAYGTCYNEIRAVNQLLANISKAPLLATTKTQIKAEATFLRAYYYFILLEHYGGIPIVGNKLYNYTQTVPATRSTFSQCVTYISQQLDSAALVLPYNQTGQNLGRASGGACQALKARLLLYAASPLFSVSGNIAGSAGAFPNPKLAPLVGYVGSDSTATRWTLAMNAAYAVISSGQFALSTDSAYLPGYGEVKAFQNIFSQGGQGRKVTNLEYIFPFMLNPGSTYLPNLFNPPSRAGADGAFPYESTVEAFPMINGLAITDPASGYDANNPYANRDPRLNASIIYNGSLLGNRNQYGQIEGYSPVNVAIPVVNGVKGSGTEDAVYQGTKTGYYCNKMVNPYSAAASGLNEPDNTMIPILRYTEVLLNYAEALNEVSGPVANVYAILVAIRQRAGILPGSNNLYGLAQGMSQPQMRTAIQNERQVELAFEGNRFFDVRRWLIAPTTENAAENCMEVDVNSSTTSTAPATITYTQFLVRKHIFTAKMYFWPFPQLEVGKGNGLLQNPGYN